MKKLIPCPPGSYAHPGQAPPLDLSGIMSTEAGKHLVSPLYVSRQDVDLLSSLS